MKINSSTMKLVAPPLKAVILAGGRSSRMGEDKAEIHYYDRRPQQLYMADLCHALQLSTYISKSQSETRSVIDSYPVIKDTLEDHGPLGAISSVIQHDPEAAWLVLACDLAYLDKGTILSLINQRDTTKYATAYKIKRQDFPEPLLAIYEPRIYNRIHSSLAKGNKSPRKLLMNCVIHTIEIEEEKKIFNVNLPKDKERILRNLNE